MQDFLYIYNNLAKPSLSNKDKAFKKSSVNLKLANMNINATLWHEKRNDGSAPVKLSINHNGTRVYYNLKIDGIKQYATNKGRQVEFDGGEFTKLKANYIKLNSYLRSEISKAEVLCQKNPLAPAKTIIEMMEGRRPDKDTFIGYFERIIADCECGKLKVADGTLSIYKKTIKRIKEFSAEVMISDFNTINKKWYTEFVYWLRTPKKDKNNPDADRKIRSDNTVGTYIKIIKVILNKANEDQVSDIVQHKMKYFKTIIAETDGVYLTEAEIERVENLDLSEYEHLQVERDRFLVSYYFLLRFSDSLRFNDSHFIEDKGRMVLKIETLKTGALVIVPVSEKAYSLLKKYDFKMPDVSNTKSNAKIKDICRLADIDEVVTCNHKKRQKFEFVTTHTARRSRVTNLIREGVPIPTIMKLGGWGGDSKSFKLYNKISLMESADIAAEFGSFKNTSLKVA